MGQVRDVVIVGSGGANIASLTGALERLNVAATLSTDAEEIRAARAVLKSLGLRRGGVELIACPGCGRAHADVAAVAARVQEGLADIAVDLQVAVMGCEVNGPGEARQADLGIAACPKGWVFFRRGKIAANLSPKHGAVVLVAEARKLAKQRRADEDRNGESITWRSGLTLEEQ